MRMSQGPRLEQKVVEHCPECGKPWPDQWHRTQATVAALGGLTGARICNTCRQLVIDSDELEKK